jgi:hypothetical protein
MLSDWSPINRALVVNSWPIMKNIFATKTQRPKDEHKPKVSLCVLVPGLWQFT